MMISLNLKQAEADEIKMNNNINNNDFNISDYEDV